MGFGSCNGNDVTDGFQQGKYAATLTAVKARAARLRSWLFARPEKTIVLVTHGAFLHYLMEDWRNFDYERGEFLFRL